VLDPQQGEARGASPPPGAPSSVTRVSRDSGVNANCAVVPGVDPSQRVVVRAEHVEESSRMRRSRTSAPHPNSTTTVTLATSGVIGSSDPGPASQRRPGRSASPCPDERDDAVSARAVAGTDEP